jgi:hypothetical protein
VFLTQKKAKLCKNLIVTLVFEKKRQFLTQKITETDFCAFAPTGKVGA